jgi:hypothetical protein
VSYHSLSPSAVAIPVKDEESHIGACLAALLGQTQPADHIVLLLNNCTDRSAQIVRRMAYGVAQVHVVEQVLTGGEASAGHARLLAMDAAAELLGNGGAILTTDADGRVPRDWVERNLTWLAEGYDAVCGMAMIDPVDEAAIPAHLISDDALETEYTALLDEIDSIIDPRADDPWPRHTHHSGASIAVTTAAYRSIGGLPQVAVGEDRALIEALMRRDSRIRHDPAIRVMVSGRVVGRADGGMAATIARRIVVQDLWADDRLERPAAALRRARLRGAARRVWMGLGDPLAIAAALRLPPATISEALSTPCFGAGWSAIEAQSPVLRRAPVAMAALEGLIEEARFLLAQMRPETTSTIGDDAFITA